MIKLNKTFIIILAGILLAGFSFGMSVMPIVLFSAEGVDTDSVIVQQFFQYEKTVFNIGLNLKRVGLSAGYITPYLMEGIVVHGGVYFDWPDISGRQFNPKFSLGLTIRF